MAQVVNVRVKYIRPEYQNLKEWTKDPDNVYIGRKSVVFIDKKRFPPKNSIFANPFKVKKDGTLEEVLEKYREYIWDKINSGEITEKDLKKLEGKNLGCWCKPKECHGDVLIEILDEYFGEDAESSEDVFEDESSSEEDIFSGKESSPDKEGEEDGTEIVITSKEKKEDLVEQNEKAISQII